MTARELDFRYMALALRLARKGRGKASPNPMVGAVVVKQDRIVGQGFHLHAGLPHAEILALRRAGVQARGATLYVTLEPCCHLRKRTPPCVPEVLRSGVSRVVIAMRDPNPSVSGRGIAALRRSGLSVAVGIARQEAAEVNKAYSHWIRAKRPFVTLKAGMTLDGQIATASGESRWITSMQSRREVHQLRGQTDAVLIGIGTVLSDDPSLTARTGEQLSKLAPRQPLRVVTDSRLRIPLTARILLQQNRAKTIVATTSLASARRRAVLARRGVETILLPMARGQVSLSALLKELGRRGITSVLLEGGSQLNGAMLRAKLVDRIRLYIAPELLGGDDAKGLIGGSSSARLDQSLTLRHVRSRSVGRDIVVEGDV